jgi:hypothetical protein
MTELGCALDDGIHAGLHIILVPLGVVSAWS